MRQGSARTMSAGPPNAGGQEKQRGMQNRREWKIRVQSEPMLPTNFCRPSRRVICMPPGHPLPR